MEQEKKDDSGCYLTTACMRAMGGEFEDNCKELMILRDFRDNYVMANHPDAVKEYYRIAPKIVNIIGMQKDSQSIYLKMYQELVLGTISLIGRGMPAEAFALYKNYGNRLAKEYCIIPQ